MLHDVGLLLIRDNPMVCVRPESVFCFCNLGVGVHFAFVEMWRLSFSGGARLRMDAVVGHSEACSSFRPASARILSGWSI